MLWVEGLPSERALPKPKIDKDDFSNESHVDKDDEQFPKPRCGRVARPDLWRTSPHRCVPTYGAVCYPDAGNQQVGGVDPAVRVGHWRLVDLMVP